MCWNVRKNKWKCTTLWKLILKIPLPTQILIFFLTYIILFLVSGFLGLSIFYLYSLYTGLFPFVYLSLICVIQLIHLPEVPASCLVRLVSNFHLLLRWSPAYIERGNASLPLYLMNVPRRENYIGNSHRII